MFKIFEQEVVDEHGVPAKVSVEAITMPFSWRRPPLYAVKWYCEVHVDIGQPHEVTPWHACQHDFSKLTLRGAVGKAYKVGDELVWEIFDKGAREWERND